MPLTQLITHHYKELEKEGGNNINISAIQKNYNVRNKFKPYMSF